jgi:hypothetical protein
MARYFNGIDAAADYRIKKMRKLERHHAEGLHADRPAHRCPDCELAATQSEQSHTEEGKRNG